MKTKNVVLVHGAFAEGSGYKGIYEILLKKDTKQQLFRAPQLKLLLS